MIAVRCPTKRWHTMQRLEIELFVRFRRYAPRRGTLYGFCNRQRIPKIILVSLPEGLGIDRRHLPHVVAEGEQLTGHIVRSHACLYPDQAWQHIREPSTISVRATFSRSTIAPRASRPTRCSVFLPGSIPIVTIAVLNSRGMAR